MLKYKKTFINFSATVACIGLIGGGISILSPQPKIDHGYVNFLIHKTNQDALNAYQLDLIEKNKDKVFIKSYKQLNSFGRNEVNWIIKALYHEARGETPEGLIGVAYSLINRKNRGGYGGKTFKSVVSYVNKDTGNCEYSFMCDGRSDKVNKNHVNYNTIKKIAVYTYQGKLDLLTEVVKTTRKRRGHTVYITNNDYKIDRTLTLKVKKTFFYATYDYMKSIKFRSNAFFYKFVYGSRKDECYKIKVGNHVFLVAKKNSRLERQQ